MVKPALARAGEGRRGRVRGRADRMPDREEYILVGLKLGGNRETLGRQFDEWKASQEADGGNP